MHKFAVVVFVLLCGAFAAAQLEPKAFDLQKSEIYGGFVYEHADISGSQVPTDTYIDQSSASLKGFAIDFSHYQFHNLGYTVELARVWTKAIDNEGDGYSRMSYLAGPTYRLHRYGFFSPSIHVLAGVEHAVFTVPVPANKLSYANTDFAAAAGGTLDGNLSRHLAIRLAQVDYLYTHHYGGDQSSFRYSGGIVIHF